LKPEDQVVPVWRRVRGSSCRTDTAMAEDRMYLSVDRTPP
jgi:hypothetical protein